MADSQIPKSTHMAERAHQDQTEGVSPASGSSSVQPRSSLGASESARAVQADAVEPAVTDQVDEAIVESANNGTGGRPHEMPTAGNVQVGETGDLNELAKARRLSKEGTGAAPAAASSSS